MNQIVQDLTTKLYQQAQEAQQAQGGEQSGQSKDDDTVDGDFREVDPDKDK